MRPNPNETLESWADRVEIFEKGRALQELARGRDIEIVIEEMSRRIVDKMMHPIFKSIRESSTASNYNAEESRRQYKEKYLDNNPHGVADHIESNT
jgi:glutamyl-tRNA reductase